MNNKKLLASLMVGSLLLTASCSSENVWDYDGSGTVDDNEYVDVTFAVSSDGASLLTRADDIPDDGGPGRWQTLSKGSKIDMLIYAVYDEDYTLLTQYGLGIEDDTQNKLDNFIDGSNPHTGQTIRYVGDKLYKGEKVQITLRLMRKKQYHLALWAQSSETDAYDTNDLRHVEVNYNNGVFNNDESRDVFSKVETFTVSSGGVNQTIILTRPVAQINVGTTGADYKNLEKGTYITPNRTVTYSKIELEGVAKYFDVVADKVITKTDIENATAGSPYAGLDKDNATTTVTYDWALIPAYYKMNPIPSTNLFENNEEDGEEFLKIDLNQDGEILSYRTSYPTLGSQGGFMTEEFKYLSMCYVLVPNAIEDAETDNTYSRVLDSVKVWFSEGANGTNGFESINITQVPARRNWRTNILGGLYWMSDPTDPNDPYDDPDIDPEDPDTPPTPPEGPDPSTLFNTVKAGVTIVSDYFDDFETIIVSDGQLQNNQ